MIEWLIIGVVIGVVLSQLYNYTKKPKLHTKEYKKSRLKSVFGTAFDQCKANFIFMNGGMPEMMNKGFDAKAAQEMVDND